MAETYTKKNGRLVNSLGEWVWNGESYEYVTSHSDWLPLVFKNQKDANEFELLEKIWKAEQIIKTSHNKQEVTLAKEWLKNHGVKHSDDDTQYIAHFGFGKTLLDHKYIRREPLKNGKYRYIYEEAKNKVFSRAANISDKKESSQPDSTTQNSEYKDGHFYYNYNDKTGRISMDKDAKKRLKDLKKEAKKAAKEVEKTRNDKSLHNPEKKIINGKEYYKTEKGDYLSAGKYGEYVRSQEQAANSASAKVYANYSRQLRLAEKEKEELKKYRAECQKAARKEFVDSIADKGMSIINKLFKRS